MITAYDGTGIPDPRFNQKWGGPPVTCSKCPKTGRPFFNYVQWKWLMIVHRDPSGQYCQGSYGVIDI